MDALRDFDTNTSVAVAAKRFGIGSVGGVTTRSRQYAKALHSKNFGSVMAIDDLFEEEDVEMRHVFAIGQKSNQRFGKKNKDPPFYEPFKSREAKDAARKAFGPFCLNCGSSDHLLASAQCFNKSFESPSDTPSSDSPTSSLTTCSPGTA